MCITLLLITPALKSTSSTPDAEYQLNRVFLVVGYYILGCVACIIVYELEKHARTIHRHLRRRNFGGNCGEHGDGG